MLSLALLVPLALAPQSSDAEAAPKARTTVLHLEGGRVVRAKARELDGAWEVWSDGAWTRIPAESVVRARPEREVLDQAQELERALPKDDLVRRVAYADWLLGEGLAAESLRQLDRVLAREPDQPDALALLGRADVRIALPPLPADAAGLDAYLAASARLDGAARELAVVALRAAPEIPGLRERMKQELVARTPGRRALATLVMRRMFAGEEPQQLLSRAVLDSSDEVRTGAALALKAFDDPSVIAPALRAVGSRNPEVRANAIEALATMEYREAVEPLYTHLVALQAGGGSAGAPRVHIFNGRQFAYVQDFDVEVAQNQSIADPVINVLVEGSVLDVAVVGATEYVVASERASVRRALAKLTGANPGDTTVAWQRWWKEHGDEWQAGRPPQKTPTTPAGQG